jgi:tRNA nucleotidyltransferase (CCA-adding enzyme)
MEVITTHINADFDSLASMLAAKKLYPGAVLVFPGSTEKNLRDFFLQSTFYVFQAERMKNVDLKAVKRLILVDTRQAGRIGKFGEVARRPVGTPSSTIIPLPGKTSTEPWSRCGRWEPR